MDASDPIRPSKNSCGTGAVHIWVPAFAGTTKLFFQTYFFTSEHAGSGGPNASSPEIFVRIL